MWILIRLVLAAVGFAIRQWKRRKKLDSDSEGVFEGVPYYVDLETNKGKTIGFEIGMTRTSPAWLKFHTEGVLDRFFKWLRLSTEAQTGDQAFDKRVYITCDHPAVASLLTEDAELRDALLVAFDEGKYKTVSFDGQTVWLERNANAGPTDADLRMLKAIRDRTSPLEGTVPSRLADAFLWKALIVEGVIWSIFGYAIGAFVEQIAHSEDYHVRSGALFSKGLVVAVVLFAILISIIALWLRGSSRGHRVILESLVVLVIGLPSTGIQIVGDTNRALDDGPSLTVRREIEQCERRLHRRKRSTYYTYHVWPREPGPDLPEEIEVTEELCDAVDQGASRIDVAIASGAWGIPWYRHIQIGDASWSPP